ncbi:MAG: FecR family protein [Bacteroidota bacterium]
MNHRSFALVAIVAGAALLTAPAWNFQQDKKAISAYIIKVVSNVEKRTPTTGWAKAVTLSELKSGHEVRTGEKSFAMIKFSDESKVAVRPKSVLTIQGEVEGRQILNRNVIIERGRAVFNIRKQESEQFRFTSPISVASIRGTEGGTGFEPGNNEADITIITGVADFQSTVTNCQTTVGAGQKGTIDSTGQCQTGNASANDLNQNNPNSDQNQGGDQDVDQGGGTQKDTSGTQSQRPAQGPRFSLNSSLSESLRSGQAASLRVALANPPVVISSVTLFYRIQGDATYKSLVMTLSGQNVSGTVPAGDIKAGSSKTFEYYFSMAGSDGVTYTFPEADPEANPYTLPITPRIITIRIPLTDPSGTQKFLEISYEE